MTLSSEIVIFDMVLSCQVDVMLGPTWPHFGRALGTKLASNCLQVASETDPQVDQKNNQILDRLGIEFWSILASNLGPKK